MNRFPDNAHFDAFSGLLLFDWYDEYAPPGLHGAFSLALAPAIMYFCLN